LVGFAGIDVFTRLNRDEMFREPRADDWID